MPDTPPVVAAQPANVHTAKSSLLSHSQPLSYGTFDPPSIDPNELEQVPLDQDTTINEDNTTLLGSKKKEAYSWKSWLWQQTASTFTAAATSIVGSIKYFIKHPITVFLSVITAAPTALNALVVPSGKSLDKFGQAWQEMSGLKRAQSIANGSSAFLVNFIMSALFIPTALSRLQVSFKHMFDSPKDFFDNTFALLFAIGGAIAAGAIAYEALITLPVGGAILAASSAGVSILITFASRYIGAKNAFNRIRNIFDEDVKTQTDFADKLQHVHKDHLKEAQEAFDQIKMQLKNHTPHTPLNPKEMERLTFKLARFANKHPDFFTEKTTAEYALQYAGMTFELVFALGPLAVPAFVVFMDKGWSAVKTVGIVSAHTNLDTHLNVWAKRGIGIIPGLASALLYTNYGLEFFKTLGDLACYLYQYPKNIPFALGLITANGFAASSMQCVAEHILEDKHNIIGVEKDTLLGDVLIDCTAFGGFVVNTTTTLKKAFFSTPPQLEDLTVNQFARYIKQANEHPLSHRTNEKLRSLRLFSPLTITPAPQPEITFSPQNTLTIS